MAQENHVILGLFNDPEWARHAQAVLKAVGFASADIGLLEPHRGPARRPHKDARAGLDRHASQRVTSRATGVGSIAEPLVGKGMPERQAQFYEAEVRRGNSLLAVRTRETADLAESILHRFGAYDVRPGSGHRASAVDLSSKPVSRLMVHRPVVQKSP
jgi:hypothetical protein